VNDFNFTEFFKKLGNEIVAELRSLMLKQKGVDGSAYSPLDAKTVRQKSKHGSLTPEKRMFDTKDFWGKAFLSEGNKNSVTVFISQALHGRKLRSLTKTLEKYRATGNKKFVAQSVKVSKATEKAIAFDQLATYQNESGKSLFFPVDASQVSKLQSVQRAIPNFKDEVVIQVKNVIPDLLKTRIYAI
jgi:hypothetical protein